jgi:drug/metabolite transporter (DMT)-like permease
MARPEATLLQTSIAFLVFATCNVGLNYFNAWALSKPASGIPGDGSAGFDFPWFYTMWHMAMSSLASLVMMMTCTPAKSGLPTAKQFWDYKYFIVPLSSMTILNYGLNNMSLGEIALFTNQVIKATSTLPTAAFEFLIQGKVYNLAIYTSTTTMVGGGILSSVHSLNGNYSSSNTIRGVVVCIIGMLASALKPVIQNIATATLTDETRPPLSPAQALFYDNGISFFAMAICWLIFEKEDTIKYFNGDFGNENAHWLGLFCVVVSSILAFFHNIANYYYIMYTSALTANVGGAGIKCFMIVSSAIQFHVHDPSTWTGVIVVVVSILAYAYLVFQFKECRSERLRRRRLTSKRRWRLRRQGYEM